MAATITVPQQEAMKRLLRSGRWNNKNEIIRYGIELVCRELDKQELSPYPDSVLQKAYRQLGRQDVEADAKLGRASARPSPVELD